MATSGHQPMEIVHWEYQLISGQVVHASNGVLSNVRSSTEKEYNSFSHGLKDIMKIKPVTWGMEK
ncbi:MAG: hypothetical protein IPN79_12095 [Saprospiraceae bacterium]|nr:hypothetical protein [Saprospiraceae bacterium]